MEMSWCQKNLCEKHKITIKRNNLATSRAATVHSRRLIASCSIETASYAASTYLTVVLAMLWTSSPGSAGYRTLSSNNWTAKIDGSGVEGRRSETDVLRAHVYVGTCTRCTQLLFGELVFVLVLEAWSGAFRRFVFVQPREG